MWYLSGCDVIIPTHFLDIKWLDNFACIYIFAMHYPSLSWLNSVKMVGFFHLQRSTFRDLFCAGLWVLQISKDVPEASWPYGYSWRIQIERFRARVFAGLVVTFTFTVPLTTLEYKCWESSTCDRLALISLYSETRIKRGHRWTWHLIRRS